MDNNSAIFSALLVGSFLKQNLVQFEGSLAYVYEMASCKWTCLHAMLLQGDLFYYKIII